MPWSLSVHIALQFRYILNEIVSGATMVSEAYQIPGHFRTRLAKPTYRELIN